MIRYKALLSNTDIQFEVSSYSIKDGNIMLSMMLPSYYDWKFEETSETIRRLAETSSHFNLTICKEMDSAMTTTIFKGCSLKNVEVDPLIFSYNLIISYLYVNENESSSQYYVSSSQEQVKPNVITLSKENTGRIEPSTKEKDIKCMSDSEKREYIQELKNKIDEVTKTFDTPLTQRDQDNAIGWLVPTGSDENALSQKYKIVNASDNVRYQILSLKKSFSEDTPHTDFIDYNRPYSFQELLNNQIHWARMCEDTSYSNEEFYGPIVDFVEEIVKSYNDLLERK